MTNGVNRGFCDMLAQSSGAPRRRYKQYTTGTYIGLIGYAIKDSPDKMLTFKQIMTKLEPFVFGDKKGIENNIRVCLSSNRCFAKVPVDPDHPNPKKNFWKLDESGITPKMFRRHFKYIMNTLPGKMDECKKNSYAAETFTPVSGTAESKSEVKFTGPFSIESILKSDCEEKRMRSTPSQPLTGTKGKHFNDAAECYYPVLGLGSQEASAKRPRLSSGPQFELSLPQHIAYDHRLVWDTRYVGW